jgi:dTDP-4-dehydrorhamnose 3,5-epimerase
MKLVPLPLEGACLVHGYRLEDERGWFWKNYLSTEFKRLDLNFECRETFFSYSLTGVLRGLHFQAPPNASRKLVTCLSGRVLDLAVDIRANSATYGHISYVELGGDEPVSVYLPEGFAHGFYVREGPAILAYQTNVPYDPTLDSGIRWDTLAIEWPKNNLICPIVSHRDNSLIDWNLFKTPFK